MTTRQVLAVVDAYEELLCREGAIPQKVPSERAPASREEALNHAVAMIDGIRTFLEEGRTEKAMRWLGFVQALMWRDCGVSLDRLKDDNRSPPSHL